MTNSRARTLKALCLGTAALALATVCNLPPATFHAEARAEEAYPATLVLSAPIFFAAANYLGEAVMLGVGSYTQAALVAKGIATKSVSSVRVQPGFKVEAFSNGDFTGPSIILSGDTPFLSARAFDNQLSSMRISQISVGAIFYDLCDRQGYNVNLPGGHYTTQALATWGIKNDTISGLAPYSGMEVQVYTNDSFSGQARLYNTPKLCLSTDASNTTSSLSIRASKVLFSDNFNNSSVANWTPLTGTWQAVDGRMQGIGWGGNDSGWNYVSSVSNVTGDVVIDVDVDMTCAVCTPNAGETEFLFNSTERWVNEYRISLWPSTSFGYRNRYQIQKYKNGVFTGGADYEPNGDSWDGNILTPVPIPPKCHVTVRRVGNWISIFVNNVKLTAVLDNDPLPAQGRVGVGVIWDVHGAFDNFVVRN